MISTISRGVAALRDLCHDLIGRRRPPRPRPSRFAPPQFDTEYEALLARMARSLSAMPPPR